MVVRRSLADIIRDAVLAVLALLAAIYLHVLFVRIGALKSGDTFAAEFGVTIAIGLCVIVALFAVWFVAEGLLITPYVLWREKEQASPNSGVPAPIADERIIDLFKRIDESPAFITPADAPDERLRLIGEDIQDKLSLGIVRVWGREIIGHPFTTPLSEIEHTHWKRAHFTFYFLNEKNRLPHTWNDRGVIQPLYDDLRFSSVETRLIWP